MANPSKKKGTAAETKVARYLGEHGLPTERRALAGSEDQGDLRMLIPTRGAEVTVEVKAGKQTRGYTRQTLDRWKEQTIRESKNSGCSQSMLVIVGYRRKFEDAQVWMPNWEWERETMPGWTMMYLDEFVTTMGG